LHDDLIDVRGDAGDSRDDVVDLARCLSIRATTSSIPRVDEAE
jgi:hypothetical protein